MAKKYYRKNTAENYIKRHDFLRRWISVMMVVALLITTVTLYAMNKAASAVTEEGAEEVGMVLNPDTLDSDSEESSGSEESDSEESGGDESSEEETSGDSEEASEEGTEGASGDTSSDDEASGDGEASDDVSDSSSSEDSAEGDNAESESSESETSEEGSAEGTDGESADGETSEDGQTEEIPGEGENTDESLLADGELPDEELTDEEKELSEEGSEKELKGEKLADGIKLDQDVKLTVSYVDENGELIKNEDGEALADERQMNLSEGLDLTEGSNDIHEIEGYTYLYATLDGTVVSAIAVKTAASEAEETETDAENQGGFKYYEVVDANGSTYDVTSDAALFICYMKSEEEIKEEVSGKRTKVIIDDVTISASYVDNNGEHVKDDARLDISGTLDLSQVPESEKLEGYFYKEVTYQDKKVVSVNVVEKDITDEMIDKAIEEGKSAELTSQNTSKTQDASDRTQDEEKSVDATSETEEFAEDATVSSGRNIVIISEDEDGVRTIEEGSATTYKTYEVVTADGESIELTEDSEIIFSYLKANSKEEFKVTNDKVTVTARLSNPGSLPEGIELVVSEISKESNGYNYDAYLQAMNDNAEKIAQESGQAEAQTYDSTNTLIYDICFKLDGVEYQPEEGTVAVSIQLNENQVSDELGAENAEDVTVLHMPVSEEVMQEVVSTEEAVNISSDDIAIEVMQESNVDLDGNKDNIEFETDSFSAWAITTSGTYTWKGNQTMSPQEIASGLGDSIYFSVVAEQLDVMTHSEGNVAVINLGECKNESIGNSANVYTHMSDFELTVTRTAKKAGRYNFAIYTTADGSGSPIHTFSIDVPTDGGSSTYTVPLSAGSYVNLYVFELDSKGKPIKDSGKYVSSDKAAGSNSLIGTFSDNYIENLGKNTGGTILQKVPGQTINLYVKNENKVYRKTGDKVESAAMTGSYPISVTNLLSKAYDLSMKLAYLQSDNSVEVVNVKAQTGTFREDVGSALSVDQNWVTNTGFGIGNKLLVINLDLTKYVNRSYRIMQFKVNGQLTGQQWEEVANQIIINPLQKDSNGNYVPYTGTLILDTASGTVVAPAAYINHAAGNHIGSIIAKTVNHSSGEIHKMTIHRYMNLKGNVSIKDDTTQTGNALEFTLHKKINGSLDNVTDTFNFTLERLVDKNRWVTVERSITNSGNTISYKIDDVSENDKLKDMVSGETYYFKFSENNLEDGSYVKDSSIILVKVKNFGTSNSETNYYRVSAYETDVNGNAVLDENGIEKTNSEFAELLASPSKAEGLCNDAHRIRNEDDIAFNNTRGGSIIVKKTWNYDSFKYPYIYIYLCARAEGRDIPELSKLVTLNWENGWSKKVDGLRLTTDKGNPIIYRAAEINAIDANTGLIAYDTVKAMLDNNDHSLFVYDDEDIGESRTYSDNTFAYMPGTDIRISKPTNGYVVCYSTTVTNMSEKYGGSSWQRVGMVDGHGGEVTVTNTQITDFELTKNWVLDGKSPPDPKDIKVELWMYSGNIADQATGLEPTLTKDGVTPTVEGADAAWKYTWKNLPCFDVNGEAITYYVKETVVPDGFSSNAEETGKDITLITEGYRDSVTGCERLRTASITNTAKSLTLKMFKFLDNVDPGTEKYEFWIRMYDPQTGQVVGKYVGGQHNTIYNNGKDIELSIIPSVWNMTIGGTYYFIVREGKAVAGNAIRCTLDPGMIIAKVLYTSSDTADITYYKVEDQEDTDAILGATYTNAPEYCTHEVTGDEVAFKNRTGETMDIFVYKEWDNLVGPPLTDSWTPDNIFDITVKLYRKENGQEVELASRQIVASDNSTADAEKIRLGERGVYPSTWTGKSTPLIFRNYAVNDANGNPYEYYVKEFYKDTELVLKGDTVNGFKLDSIDEKVKNGDKVFTLHNKPYLIIEKEWTVDGVAVPYEQTKSFDAVFVNLYQSYRNSANDESYENGLKIIESKIVLSYDNHWTYEVAVERKHDAKQQYVYHICECDSKGVEYGESDRVTYFSYNYNNVTKLNDYRYIRGFTDRMNGGVNGTHVWQEAYVSGNNFPYIKLKVVNERSGYVLPNSGGGGTRDFYLGGLALIMIALGGLGILMLRKYGHRRN